MFAHGSGSGRRSPRNRFVSQVLVGDRIATLLLDLLTPAEAEEDAVTGRFRFDIPRLAERLSSAIDWAEQEPRVQRLPLGIYGASTGGAAALIAAASRPHQVRALVLRGARSDLADRFAERVTAPTLFVVGERDPVIRDANRATARRIRGPTRLVVVPRASHLFEEEGALDVVAENGRRWFGVHLTPDLPYRIGGSEPIDPRPPGL